MTHWDHAQAPRLDATGPLPWVRSGSHRPGGSRTGRLGPGSPPPGAHGSPPWCSTPASDEPSCRPVTRRVPPPTWTDTRSKPGSRWLRACGTDQNSPSPGACTGAGGRGAGGRGAPLLGHLSPAAPRHLLSLSVGQWAGGALHNLVRAVCCLTHRPRAVLVPAQWRGHLPHLDAPRKPTRGTRGAPRLHLGRNSSCPPASSEGRAPYHGSQHLRPPQGAFPCKPRARIRPPSPALA